MPETTFENTIAQIKQRADLSVLIGSYVDLKKKGHNYLGLCPFHNEKTPSFYVHPDKGFFKCFGCGVSGDVFTFLEKKEGLSFKEAAQRLAEQYNLELAPQLGGAKAIEKTQAARSISNVLAFANNFFKQSLNGENGKHALSYLKDERKLNTDIIQTFELGYGHNNEQALWHYSRKDDRLLSGYRKLGLIQERQTAKSCAFAQRITFPIKDTLGKIVGFGGRALPDDNTSAKYINSARSDVYDKSQVLYGLYEAIPLIEKGRPLVLVEGYFDVLAIHSLGLPAVAPCGTSLTAKQVNNLAKHVSEIIILFDGDSAGKEASAKASKLLLSADIFVRSVVFDNLDPADLWQQGQKKRLFDGVMHAPDMITYLVDEAKQKSTHLYDRLIKLDNIFELITHINRPLLQKNYLREIANVFSEQERDVISEFFHYCKTHNKRLSNNSVKKEAVVSRPIQLAEKWLISAALAHPAAVLNYPQLLAIDFHSEVIHVLQQITKAAGSDSLVETKNLLKNLEIDKNSVLLPTILQIASEEREVPLEEAIQYFEDCIKKEGNKKKDVEIQKLRSEMASAQSEGDLEKVLKSLKMQSQRLAFFSEKLIKPSAT